MFDLLKREIGGLGHRLGAWLVILGLAAFAVVCTSYQARIASLVATLGGAQDAALGPDWTKVRSSRNLGGVVPDLREQLAAAKKAGTRTVIATQITTGEAAFHLPDEGRCSTPPGAPVEAGAASPPASPPLHVSGRAQGALTLLADGRLKQTWRMWATLRRGEWSETEELPDVNADAAIDPKLQTILDDWAKRPPRIYAGIRPLRYWRAGWSCGVGGLVGPSGAIAAGAGCLYGGQF